MPVVPTLTPGSGCCFAAQGKQEEAKRLYALAAEAGGPEGQFRLGDLREQEGLWFEVVRLYRLAAPHPRGPARSWSCSTTASEADHRRPIARARGR
jgi:TPR repeat protein